MFTNLLIRLFIGKNKDEKNPAVRAKYASLASLTGVFVNILLFAAKLSVGLLAMSVAIIADAFNNITDAGSAIIALVGFRLALKPVDKEHPLGHGRLEYVSAFIVDAIIILVGFELFTASIDKIVNPVAPTLSVLTFVFLGIAVPVKLWLFFFYRKIGKKISSASLLGASADSVSDALATFIVLLSAIVYKAFGWNIDGYAGILVAGFILFTGLKASKETIDLLLGTPPQTEFIDEIYAFALSFDGIYGVHDVMVHDYGPGRKFIAFHAEVPSSGDMLAAHDIIDDMERKMEEKFSAVVTVHMDPIETDNALVLQMREFAQETVKEIDESFLIHDFRLTYGGKHINLIFDLCVPLESKISLEDAAKMVSKRISEKKENCYAVIKPEYPYV